MFCCCCYLVGGLVFFAIDKIEIAHLLYWRCPLSEGKSSVTAESPAPRTVPSIQQVLNNC